MHQQSPFLSIAEAAAFFRVSETTIRNCKGDFARIAHVHVGKRHLVTRESVERVATDILKRAQSVEDAVSTAMEKARRQKKSRSTAAG
jgi:hypothetical protein